MASRTCIIRNPNGLHARPARKFAGAAVAHASAVRIRKGAKTVNGKSVLAMLTLGLKCHDVVTVEIDDDDESVLTRLEQILGHAMEEDAGAPSSHNAQTRAKPDPL